MFQTSWVRGGKTLGMLLLCETHYCTTETLILSENIVQSFNYFFFLLVCFLLDPNFYGIRVVIYSSAFGIYIFFNIFKLYQTTLMKLYFLFLKRNVSPKNYIYILFFFFSLTPHITYRVLHGAVGSDDIFEIHHCYTITQIQYTEKCYLASHLIITAG